MDKRRLAYSATLAIILHAQAQQLFAASCYPVDNGTSTSSSGGIGAFATTVYWHTAGSCDTSSASTQSCVAAADGTPARTVHFGGGVSDATSGTYVQKKSQGNNCT